MWGKAIGSLNNKLKNILIRIFGAAVCMSMILTAIGILLPDELVSLKFTDSKSIAYNFGMLPITFKIEESCKCYYWIREKRWTQMVRLFVWNHLLAVYKVLAAMKSLALVERISIL